MQSLKSALQLRELSNTAALVRSTGTGFKASTSSWGWVLRTVEQIFAETIAVKSNVLKDELLLATVRAVGDHLVARFRVGSRVFMCGNGGSAADAQHFAAELTGHFMFDRPPLGAEALHANSSHITAVANDYDYATVFARALEGSARPGDTLIAISTSGNSPNVIRAAETARAIGMTVVAMTGETGGRLGSLADFLINVPSCDTGRIQESHIVFIHAISEHVEYVLFAPQ